MCRESKVYVEIEQNEQVIIQNYTRFILTFYEAITLKTLHLRLFFMKRILLYIIVSFVVSACSQYSKVLKHPDLDYRFDMALKYFNEGEYVKSLPLFEDLISFSRGTKRNEEVYFYYAYHKYPRAYSLMARYYL